jgi:exopolysaccharide biosynthesis polyprenyl glycosylphosphotransferase
MAMEPQFWFPMVALCIYWLSVYFVFGLYRSWYTQSRFDELLAVLKATTFGIFVLFFAIFIDDRGTGSPLQSRLLIAIYWALILGGVGGGRLLQHTFHRRLLEAGIGLRRALVVGWTDKARELYDLVYRYPALGYKVVGFVSTEDAEGSHGEVPVLGSVAHLPQIIQQSNVHDILIALDSSEHTRLLDVIAACNAHDVSLKIMPDLYDIISGQARTNQIYGFPLIEIMPEIMQPWERAVKRMIDIAFSFVVLFLGIPLWILVALAIRLESKGTAFYVQERVGKDGKLFKIIKFRSMYDEAEKHSGPVWAEEQDPRVTGVGKIIRRLRLDEIPQLFNVLDGDMSLVGPRPERAYFVEQFSREIPLYTRRLKVRPGITGWAQVKHRYDESIDDVRKKVQYDLFYIENMSLRMDFKILLNTIAVVLSGKGR